LTFDELVSRCKASVNLNVNDHRSSYEPIGQYIVNLEDDFDPEELKRLEAADCVYRLQFYPDTPIGFYVCYGTSLTEVLEKAEACFK